MPVVGGIQPGALRDLDPETGVKDGFTHRILFVEPDPIKVQWSEQVVSQETVEAVDKLFDALYALTPLIDRNAPEPEKQACEPTVLVFTAQGKATFVEWYNSHCGEIHQTEFPTMLKGPWGKLGGYCCSLALILALAENPASTEVDQKAVLGAITLVDEYFKGHLRQLYPKMLARQATPFDRCRGAIMRALQQRPSTYREVRQRIGSDYPGDLVRTVFEDLADAGTVAKRQRVGARDGVIEHHLIDPNDQDA